MTTLLVFCALTYAQTDVTKAITNPSFENGLDGWENDGMQAQGNSAFKLKVGNTYCEKWTGVGGKVGNASIQQTVKGLKAGTYSVSVVAQNIQEDTPEKVQTGVYVIANDSKTKVNVAAKYSVQATISDGVMTVGFVLNGATGNYVTVDDFHLILEEPTADTYTTIHAQMQKIVDEANAINKHVNSPEQTELDEATYAVETLIQQNTTEGVTEAVVRLQDAIYDYKLSLASDTETVDMTSLITNPDFEKNGSEGWVTQGMGAQGNDVFSIKSGSTYMEYWTGRGNKIGDASVSQLVAMPNGKYTLTAAAQNIQEDTPSKDLEGAYLFADEYEVNVGVRKTYALDFYVIEGQANIGFKSRSAQGNWISVDNFRLTYKGRTIDMLLSALQSRVGKAEALLDQQMNAKALENLQTAIAMAKEVTDKAGMEPIAITLRESMEAAQTSIEAYALLKTAIDDVEPKYVESGVGAEEFLAVINASKACYENTANSNATVISQEKALRDAEFLFRVNNSKGSIPTVTTNPFIARGATGALGRSTVKGSNIMEEGFCWSTHRNPTVLDNRSTNYYENNGRLYLMQPLEPATVYYVRAYAMTKDYAVGYGEERKVITLPMGNTSYWYNWGGSPEENERIDNALKECVYLYNNWSCTTNFGISCSYGSGTPTADCSYGGSMRVGPSASYQRTGTILHESNHGVGVGQQARWWDSNLHDGEWKGYRANSLVQFLNNNPNERMAGDSMHMWPYGINGAHEDTGSMLLYIGNVMITQALHEDGLIPPGHGGCKPAYVFEHEDTVKYYFTCEADNMGAGKSYLTESGTGVLSWSAPEGGVLDNDAYAWYMTYDPARQLYTIRNAKSGKYFTSSNGIKTITKSKLSDKEYFHLMVGRQEKELGNEGYGMKTRGYWILAGDDVAEPMALNATTGGKTSAPNFDISDGASTQRWMILTAEQIDQLEHAGLDVNREKLQRYLKGADALLKVAHTEKKENTTSNLEQTIAETSAAEPTMSTVSELVSAVSTMYTAISTYIRYAVPEDYANPFDLTFLVEDAQMTGTDAWGSVPVYDKGVAEFYEKTFEMSQTLVDMPKGAYRACFQGFQRPGTYTKVYKAWQAGTLEVTTKTHYRTDLPIKSIMDDAQKVAIGVGAEKLLGDELYIPNDMTAAAAYFKAGLYENEELFNWLKKADMTLTISNPTVVSADWTCLTNFRLYYYGTDSKPNDVTPIEEIAGEQTLHTVYTVSGRLVGRNLGNLRSLPRGLYLIDGRKCIVR